MATNWNILFAAHEHVTNVTVDILSEEKPIAILPAEVVPLVLGTLAFFLVTAFAAYEVYDTYRIYSNNHNYDSYESRYENENNSASGPVDEGGNYAGKGLPVGNSPDDSGSGAVYFSYGRANNNNSGQSTPSTPGTQNGRGSPMSQKNAGHPVLLTRHAYSLDNSAGSGGRGYGTASIVAPNLVGSYRQQSQQSGGPEGNVITVDASSGDGNDNNQNNNYQQYQQQQQPLLRNHSPTTSLGSSGSPQHQQQLQNISLPNYSSPSFTQGSRGEEVRRQFYKLLCVAAFTRVILLPIEALYYGSATCSEFPECVMARTVPDLTFASAFALLVLFYAQLAGVVGPGEPRGLSLVLSRKGLFLAGNVVIYAVYCILLLLTILDVLPYKIFEIVIWSVLSLIYATLLFVLGYFGPVLIKLLKPSLEGSKKGLTYRLVLTKTLFLFIFASRCVCFALAVFHRDVSYVYQMIPLRTHDTTDETTTSSGYDGVSVFTRNVVGYAILEWIPSVMILLMMHTTPSSRKRKQRMMMQQNGVVEEGMNNTHQQHYQQQQHGSNAHAMPQNRLTSSPSPVHSLQDINQQQQQYHSMNYANNGMHNGSYYGSMSAAASPSSSRGNPAHLTNNGNSTTIGTNKGFLTGSIVGVPSATNNASTIETMQPQFQPQKQQQHHGTNNTSAQSHTYNMHTRVPSPLVHPSSATTSSIPSNHHNHQHYAYQQSGGNIVPVVTVHGYGNGNSSNINGNVNSNSNIIAPPNAGNGQFVGSSMLSPFPASTTAIHNNNTGSGALGGGLTFSNTNTTIAPNTILGPQQQNMTSFGDGGGAENRSLLHSQQQQPAMATTGAAMPLFLVGHSQLQQQHQHQQYLQQNNVFLPGNLALGGAGAMINTNNSSNSGVIGNGAGAANSSMTYQTLYGGGGNISQMQHQQITSYPTAQSSQILQKNKITNNSGVITATSAASTTGVPASGSSEQQREQYTATIKRTVSNGSGGSNDGSRGRRNRSLNGPPTTGSTIPGAASTTSPTYQLQQRPNGGGDNGGSSRSGV